MRINKARCLSVYLSVYFAVITPDRHVRTGPKVMQAQNLATVKWRQREKIHNMTVISRL